ncbi:serine/threonine protein kinase, partial [Pseudomonas syringae]
MLRALRFAALLGGRIMRASALAKDVDPATYGYPLHNPLEATIASTPPDLRPKLPADSDIDQDDYTLNLRPEREQILPDNFCAVKQLRYRLPKHDHPAPLTFLLAGTGAPYTSPLTELPHTLFYQ